MSEKCTDAYIMARASRVSMYVICITSIRLVNCCWYTFSIRYLSMYRCCNEQREHVQMHIDHGTSGSCFDVRYRHYEYMVD